MDILNVSEDVKGLLQSYIGSSVKIYCVDYQQHGRKFQCMDIYPFSIPYVDILSKSENDVIIVDCFLGYPDDLDLFVIIEFYLNKKLFRLKVELSS